MRWRRVSGLAATLIACLLVLLPATAFAHASLVGSDPEDGAVLAASPGRVVLTYDEQVTAPPGGVSVYDAAGEPVESTAATRDERLLVDVPDELADGTYVLVWRVVSADGHPISGSLRFSVGAPSERVVPPDVAPADHPWLGRLSSVVAGLMYAGLLVAVGLAVFAGVVLAPSMRADRARVLLSRWGLGASVLAGCTAFLGLGLTAADQQGGGASSLLTAQVWGGVAGWSWTGFGLLLAGLVLLRLAGRRRVLLGLGVAAAVIAPALTGHSRAFGPELLVVAADAVHVLVGSVWLGGLIGLAATLPALAGRRASAALLLSRFSTLAASSLALLAATGLLLAWRIVGSWANLFGTGYGRLLLVKLLVVALVAGLACWNRFVLLPRVRRDDGHDGNLRSAVSLSRSVRVEAALLIVVLGVTGFLTQQPPRPAEPAVVHLRATSQTAPLGDDLQVVGRLDPGSVGSNELILEVQSLSGEPFAPPYKPTVSVRSADSGAVVDLGRVALARESRGRYRGAVVLPTSGAWEVRVSVRLGEFENPVATLAFDVAPPE